MLLMWTKGVPGLQRYYAQRLSDLTEKKAPTGLEAQTLTIEDAFEVLDKLANDRLGRLVLVGGQAAAFWIARYDIADPKVVTTRDIDVFLSEAEPSIVLE